MQQPRTRIWMILLGVAVAAVSLGGINFVRKRNEYQALAILHAQRAATCLTDATSVEEECQQPFVEKQSCLALAHRIRNQAAHEAGLQRKYENLACYPWLIVEPDPPEPES
jgi:hypothetical protein